MTLDHLEEECRAVLCGLREDLQQVAVVVAIRQDAQPPQVLVRLVDLADAVADVLVVGLRRVEEEDAALLQRLDRLHDVVRRERDVLDARTPVEVEVLLDLALAPALGGLVERELDLPLTAEHDLGHEGRVLRGDVLVGEVDHLPEAHHALVEAGPLVHPPELDVADHVVDRLEADARRVATVLRARDVARREGAAVLGAAHEGVHRVAVEPDRGDLEPAVLVLEPVRLHDAARAALDGLPVRLGRVRDGERDVLHAVAVPADVP